MSRLRHTHPSTARTHSQTAAGAVVTSLVAGALFVTVPIAVAVAPVPALAAVALLVTLQALLRVAPRPTRLTDRLRALVRPARS